MRQTELLMSAFVVPARRTRLWQAGHSLVRLVTIFSIVEVALLFWCCICSTNLSSFPYLFNVCQPIAKLLLAVVLCSCQLSVFNKSIWSL